MQHFRSLLCFAGPLSEGEFLIVFSFSFPIIYQKIYCSIQTFKLVNYSLTSHFKGPGSQIPLENFGIPGFRSPTWSIGVPGPRSRVPPRIPRSRVPLFWYVQIKAVKSRDVFRTQANIYDEAFFQLATYYFRKKFHQSWSTRF